MPSDDPTLAAIRQRLQSLLKCVLSYAERDSQFAGELDAVLSTPPHVKGVVPKAVLEINLVEVLKTHGEDALRETLAECSEEHLRELAKRYRVAARDIRGMSHDELVLCLSQKARERLGKGGVFLESPDSRHGAPTDRQTEEKAADTQPSEQGVSASSDTMELKPTDGDASTDGAAELASQATKEPLPE